MDPRARRRIAGGGPFCARPAMRLDGGGLVLERVAGGSLVEEDEVDGAVERVLAQEHVAESLAGLRCTRIAIAHRLSTVRRCDRILVIDEGRVAEDGTYEELMELGGIFAELAKRQRA